jgi:hypothetical protein
MVAGRVPQHCQQGRHADRETDIDVFCASAPSIQPTAAVISRYWRRKIGSRCKKKKKKKKKKKQPTDVNDSCNDV